MNDPVKSSGAQMNTIQDHWFDYRKSVMPKGCSDIQIRETRRAFYAGAATMLSVMDEIAGLGSHSKEEDAIRTIENDLQTFHDGIGTKF